MANLPPAALFCGSDRCTEFKGAMAENFVLNELKRMYEEKIYYWTAEGSGRAEVDFIVQDGADIIPIEVKAGTTGQAKSLMRYVEKFSPNKHVFTSLNQNKNNVLPLYMFWDFKKWCGGAGYGR